MSALRCSPLAEYHVSQGAVLGEYHGAVVPARFSDPRAEHFAVRKASGLFDFSFRARMAVKGTDRARFLQGMLSNDVLELTAGRGRRALLLNVHGQILADLCVYAEAERFLIDTDADLRSKVIETLGRYIIMDDVVLEPLELYALAFQGPLARPLLEKTLHLDLPEMNEYDHFPTNYAGHPVHVLRRTSTGEEGYEVWIGSKGLSPLWGAACGQAPTYDTLPCGTESLETLRIEAGLAAYGTELAEDTLPLEAGVFDAVSFTKGCYLGQEIVERARSRGHVNWKLVGVFIDSQQVPERGEKLIAESKEVGEITSACVSPTLGRVIALAYARREFAEPGTQLALASGEAAEVTALPFYRRAE